MLYDVPCKKNAILSRKCVECRTLFKCQKEKVTAMRTRLPIKSMLVSAMLAAGLTACSLAPDYQRPALPVNNVFPTEDALSDNAMAAVETGWRDFFHDPRLKQLIRLSLENNRDLRIAALRVEEARAQFAIIGAQRFPTLAADGSANRSGNLDGGSVSSNYSASAVMASYELDFFGRVKSLSDAGLYQYLATEDNARAANITLVSQVARAYLSVRLAEEQYAVSLDTLKTRQDSFKLIKQQVDAGIASDLDLKQSETLVYGADVQIASLQRLKAQAENALYQLVGSKPSLFDHAFKLSDQNYLADLPVGLPSDVLLMRPDVQAAERELQASNANIGAARAAFFPQIRLTGSVGSRSQDLSDLFNNGSGIWSFAPSISIPIFTAGSLKASLDVAKVRNSIAVANYEKTIQNAFREVSDGLVARGPLQRQLEAQNKLRNAEAQRLSLAQLRYQNGIVSYLEVLDAQRTLFIAEQSLLEVQQQLLLNAVNLYAALGGGQFELSQTTAEAESTTP